MKLSNFMVIAAIVAAVFGIAFLIAPSELVALYGVKLTPATEVIGRIAGSSILAFAIVFWGARNAKAADALKAVMVAGIVANGLDALILLHATASGLLNSYGWAQAVVNGLLGAVVNFVQSQSAKTTTVSQGFYSQSEKPQNFWLALGSGLASAFVVPDVRATSVQLGQMQSGEAIRVRVDVEGNAEAGN